MAKTGPPQPAQQLLILQIIFCNAKDCLIHWAHVMGSTWSSITTCPPLLKEILETRFDSGFDGHCLVLLCCFHCLRSDYRYRTTFFSGLITGDVTKIVEEDVNLLLLAYILLEREACVPCTRDPSLTGGSTELMLSCWIASSL